MGRTLATATQTWMEEEQALARFSRALRREDQRVMNDLINLSRQHIAESSYAGNMYPMDVYIISMLLEMSKRINRMELKLNELCRRQGVPEVVEPLIPDLPSLLDLIEE